MICIPFAHLIKERNFLLLQLQLTILCWLNQSVSLTSRPSNRHPFETAKRGDLTKCDWINRVTHQTENFLFQKWNLNLVINCLCVCSICFVSRIICWIINFVEAQPMGNSHEMTSARCMSVSVCVWCEQQIITRSCVISFLFALIEIKTRKKNGSENGFFSFLCAFYLGPDIITSFEVNEMP